MARTSTSRRRRSSYTAVQRAARAEADARLLEAAAAAMANPEVIAHRIRRAVTGMSARIASYSLRNQMLLMEQAEERGIDLCDVDTYRGWRTRGHQVRKGEHGLRIVRPVGRDDEPDSEDTDTDEPSGDDDPGAHTRVRFRFMTVFDVSQTDDFEGQTTAADTEDACTLCGAPPGEPCDTGCTCTGCTGEISSEAPDSPEPAEVAWNRLQEQITNAGYRFDWPAPANVLAGAQVKTDHDARAVHVAMFADAGDSDAVAALAVALGEIITRAERAPTDQQPTAAIEAAPRS